MDNLGIPAMDDRVIEATFTLSELQTLWLLLLRERSRVNDTSPQLQNLTRKIVEYRERAHTPVAA
jgi:hypothetical protein